MAQFLRTLSPFPPDSGSVLSGFFFPQCSDLFRKAALVAQDPFSFETLPLLDEDDRTALREETTHKWRHPKTLYYLVALCSVAAAVQGMDEAVINGANLFWAPQFNLFPDDNQSDQWIFGLINSAPYLCCAVLGCWLTSPLNHYFGRRGTIFITALFSFLTFVLGIGIGPKSATVPVFAAESAPPLIRGALVMCWQLFTAFGIMLGYVMDLAFYNVKDPEKLNITGLNWRLMLGSAGIPALFICAQVFFLPESPRWYMSKNRYPEAYDSLCRLRNTQIQAARDLYYAHVLLQAEKEVNAKRGNRFFELFKVPRNRRATFASLILMFMQQLCGINIIAYYSSSIFVKASFTETDALLASWGFGMINFLFAFPAFYSIDTFGRRNLLLTTFPMMAVFLLLTGFAFYIPGREAQIGVVALGIYLFTMSYSSGMGPVPFTYSAEVYPLYVRETGMSLSTAVLWFFNFVIAITFPPLLEAFQPQGAFGWYAAWNIFGFVMVLFFVPETKALSLEELDLVFSVPTAKHARYQMLALPRHIKKHIFRMKVKEVRPLYEFEGLTGQVKKKEKQEVV